MRNSLGNRGLFGLSLLVAVIVALPGRAHADAVPTDRPMQGSPGSAEPSTDDEQAAADDGEAAAPALPWKFGPLPLELGHGVRLNLPEGYQFLGQPQAGEVMARMGNLYNDK